MGKPPELGPGQATPLRIIILLGAGIVRLSKTLRRRRKSFRL
jgi:hypothetical protein